MDLDLVPIAIAVLVFHQIAGLDEVRDNAEGAAFRDVERGRDFSQTHAGVVGDADQDPTMFGEEAPVRHHRQLYIIF